MAEDLIVVQVGGDARGKWHVSERGNLTGCGLTIPPNPKQKYLELVDSKDRCKSEGCVRARLVHKGLA